MNLYRVTWQMTAFVDAESENEAIKIAKEDRAEDTEFLLLDCEFIAP